MYIPRSAEFSVAYDGPAVQDGSMDVKELAPALLALGTLCEDANRLLNSDRAKVAVRVQAMQPGSFHVSLDVLQHITTVLGKEGVESAKSILELLGLIVGGGGIIGVLKLIRLLRTLLETSWLTPCVGGSFSARWVPGSNAPGSTGPEYAPCGNPRVPRGIDEVDNLISITVLKGERATGSTLESGAIQIHIEGDNNSVLINENTKRLYDSPEVRKGIADVVRPLQREGIEELYVKNADEVVERIRKEECEYYDNIPADRPRTIPDENVLEYEGTYRIEKLSFAERFKWTFVDVNSEMTFNASMLDEDFRDKVEAGRIAFKNGDKLHLRIRRTTEVAPGKNARTSFEVIEVLQHYPASQQRSLLLSDGETPSD